MFLNRSFSRNTEGSSCWDVIAMPEESCKWNPERDLPPMFDQSFEITDLTSGFSQIALPTVPESPFFRLVSVPSYFFRCSCLKNCARLKVETVRSEKYRNVSRQPWSFFCFWSFLLIAK